MTRQFFLQSLRDSAHWSDAAREDDQIGNHHRVVRHAVQRSPFYRDRLGAACLQAA